MYDDSTFEKLYSIDISVSDRRIRKETDEKVLGNSDGTPMTPTLTPLMSSPEPRISMNI